MDAEAFKIFSETVYYCIQEERAKRPQIDQEKNFEHLKIGLDLIIEATKNFDDAYCIGSGGFGKVYKADLEHFDASSSSSIKGNGAMILVYEHASKGSLEDYLGNSDKMTNLSWSSNVLLGDNWKAKIADFGLSKFHPADQEASTLNIDTIAGTNMYLDPEYQKFGRLNKKSDIYSFGVVLFEMLTGRLAYDRIFTDVDRNGIAPIARHHFEKGTLMEIVDHKIKEETDR
ncbi:kinase-like domain, phloem protein 2-like protein [Tanacetum coccineum]